MWCQTTGVDQAAQKSVCDRFLCTLSLKANSEDDKWIFRTKNYPLTSFAAPQLLKHASQHTSKPFSTIACFYFSFKKYAKNSSTPFFPPPTSFPPSPPPPAFSFILSYCCIQTDGFVSDFATVIQSKTGNRALGKEIVSSHIKREANKWRVLCTTEAFPPPPPRPSLLLFTFLFFRLSCLYIEHSLPKSVTSLWGDYFYTQFVSAPERPYDTLLHMR